MVSVFRQLIHIHTDTETAYLHELEIRSVPTATKKFKNLGVYKNRLEKLRI